MRTNPRIAFAEDPVPDGHMLVVPRRHVATVYELTAPEQKAVWSLVAEGRNRLLMGLLPEGFDIGFDDGVHAAVHRVPRRKGDGLGQTSSATAPGKAST